MAFDRVHHPMLNLKSVHSYYKVVMELHADVVEAVFDVVPVEMTASPVLRMFGDYPYGVNFSVFVFHAAIPTVSTLRITPRV